MVWVGRDLKDHLVLPPCYGQEQHPPDQVAQSSIQPGPEHCQGGGSHSFPGQPVQVSAAALLTLKTSTNSPGERHAAPLQPSTGHRLP